MKVCKVSEIRELDKRAVEEYRIPAGILMENAGQAVYQVIRKEFGIGSNRFLVLCGPGNNGGDGFVVARHLHAAGANVKVLILADSEKYRGEAKQNLDILTRFPLEITSVTTSPQIQNALADSDVVVDALLGTGLDREVTALFRETIESVNKSGKKVVAIDVPSGVNGDTGRVMGTAIKADCTVTFGLPKVGNLLYPGFGQGGKLFVSHISYPQTLSNANILLVELAPPIPLPPRRADTNKMDYGPVLVIAGAANYFWAPHASAYSFLKAGGGYVHLACPKSLAPAVAKRGREVVFQPQDETASGSIALSNKDHLLQLASRMRMVVMGPGLSLNEETQELVRILAREIDKPLLLDGDGITAVAKEPSLISHRPAPTIMTPHVGEMMRLTGLAREQIENDPVNTLQSSAANLNAYLVLKGPHSLVGYPEGNVFINVSGATGGQAGMATAGTGDVLNGTIAAMYCLGLETGEAVRTGVFIHGLAGDLAALKKGPDGMTARDVLNLLPAAVRYYRENIEKIAENYYGTVHAL
ncbi:MAG: NAD(P)H-hydrate dehydratase [Dehalococcoidia bacterium]|nr:NAD(P)H-hydrate dehydratase [Dehalococcoidia bacterium]